MGEICVGLNTEFSRSSDRPFEWAANKKRLSARDPEGLTPFFLS
jgi:hypothetical protein